MDMSGNKFCENGLMDENEIPRVSLSAITVTAFLFLVPLADAVMIRHDVPDSTYTNRAQEAQFAASRVTLLTEIETTSGTLISPHHLVTAGHLVAGWVPVGSNEAPSNIGIQIGTNLLTGVYVYLFPAYDRDLSAGGFDVAIVRLSDVVTNVTPASVWTGGVDLGQRYTGIGQGRTGTGLDNNEPLSGGVYRGYENTVDYLYGPAEYDHWRGDFDNGDAAYNSLTNILYGTTNQAITGTSSAVSLPLEGTAAAGDSGSAVYVQKRSGWLLAGITSYRWYSQYCGQAGYVNLSSPDVADWLAAVAAAEATEFQFVTEVPSMLQLENSMGQLQIEGNIDRHYEVQVADTLIGTDVWRVLTNITVTTIPFTIPLPITNGPSQFFRVLESN